MKIWQVVDQGYESYDVLATYVDEQQAQNHVAALIEEGRTDARREWNDQLKDHPMYKTWTEADYLELHDGVTHLYVLEFDITPKTDNEGREVLSTIQVMAASPSWRDVYVQQNASVFVIDGQLWIYPKSGGLLVIDQLTRISGDIAPFSD